MSTIGKALGLLDAISRLDREHGLSDIARLCALDKATTRRFLVELERHGFVEQDAETRKYRIGAEPVRLARLALVAATAQVLHNGLAVLGVSAPARM